MRGEKKRKRTLKHADDAQPQIVCENMLIHGVFVEKYYPYEKKLVDPLFGCSVDSRMVCMHEHSACRFSTLSRSSAWCMVSMRPLMYSC